MHIAKADIAKDPGEFSTVSPRNWIDLKKLGRERSQPQFIFCGASKFLGDKEQIGGGSFAYITMHIVK